MKKLFSVIMLLVIKFILNFLCKQHLKLRKYWNTKYLYTNSHINLISDCLCAPKPGPDARAVACK